MIVRLEKQQQRVVRRQLLSDTVYVIGHDALKGMLREGKTELSPVEVFLSAQNFCDVVTSLPDIDEGIDDEMDDLEEDAEGENDAVLILTLAAALLQAMSKRRVGINSQKIISRIFERLDGNELFWPLIEQMTDKEDALWLEGKKNNLLDYELQEIRLDGGGSEEIKQLFEDFVGYSVKMGENSIKELLLFLERYNIDHHHAYDKELLALYEKLGIKSTTIIQPKEYVAVKHVENEIQNVAAGGTGVIKGKQEG